MTTASLPALNKVRSWDSATRVIGAVWAADSLRGRFARGAVWSMVGSVLSQGSNLAASLITARFLGREEFGKYGMIYSTVGMLGVFAGLGLGTTATKYVAEFRSRDPERAGRIIALGSAVAVLSGLLLALGLLLYAPFLAATTLHEPTLAGDLRAASALLFLNAFNGAQIGALSGFEAFKSITRINLVRGLTALPVAAAAVAFWGLRGAVWALVVTSAVTCFASQASLRKQCAAMKIRPRFSTAWTEWRVLWTFSAPAFLSGTLVGPAMWAANAILVNQPGGYAEMGLFSAASQWRNAIGFLPGVLAQLALPILSNLNGERDMARYGRALRWNLILATAAAAAVAAPVALASPLIMRMYGHGFEQGTLVLALSAATAVIACANTVVGTAIVSAGAVWTGFAFNAMWASVLLLGSYIFVPRRLAMGLACSLLAAYVAHTIWQSLYLRRVLSALTIPNGTLSPDL